jgi:hypothetical protein
MDLKEEDVKMQTLFNRYVYRHTTHPTKQGMRPTLQTTVVLGSKPFANLHYDVLDETLQLT